MIDIPNIILPKDEDSRLGRREPQDWEHVDRHSLTLETINLVPQTGTPVVIGVSWYANFYEPVRKDNKFWIGLDHRNLGKLYGGHCVCLKPPQLRDPMSWYDYYDQGQEGACFPAQTRIQK